MAFKVGYYAHKFEHYSFEQFSYNFACYAYNFTYYSQNYASTLPTTPRTKGKFAGHRLTQWIMVKETMDLLYKASCS